MRNKIAPTLGAAILTLSAGTMVRAGRSPELENDAVAVSPLAKLADDD